MESDEAGWVRGGVDGRVGDFDFFVPTGSHLESDSWRWRVALMAFQENLSVSIVSDAGS